MKNEKSFGYEKIIGRTPNGGAYSEIHYYKDTNISCEKSEATYCIIYERKKNGKLINTIYGIL
ncbi:MAG: hypothetical protein J6B34_05245 [Clostridia bacterium]|nr:hypothetical protein [Clostridia bacterium]